MHLPPPRQAASPKSRARHSSFLMCLLNRVHPQPLTRSILKVEERGPRMWLAFLDLSLQTPRSANSPNFVDSSAKDKAILEAAYKANPKPDKAARLEIVERVSLNEKEVQVCSILTLGHVTRLSMCLSPRSKHSSGFDAKPVPLDRFGFKTEDRMIGESHARFLLRNLLPFGAVECRFCPQNR